MTETAWLRHSVGWTIHVKFDNDVAIPYTPYEEMFIAVKFDDDLFICIGSQPWSTHPGNINST